MVIKASVKRFLPGPLFWLVLLCVTPPLLGSALYFAGVGRGAGDARGELVVPSRMVQGTLTHPLVADKSYSLAHRWTLLLLVPQDCEDICVAGLATLLAVEQGLAKKANRLQRAVLGPEQMVLPAGRDADPGPLRWLQWPAVARYFSGLPQHPGGMFLIDPQGQLMMYYPAGSATADILHDLRRLLRVSHIG